MLGIAQVSELIVLTRKDAREVDVEQELLDYCPWAASEP